MAQLCAMVELYPDKFPQDAWNVYHDRIYGLAKDRLSRVSGPIAWEKHHMAVMDKVQDYFLSNFSQSLRMEDLVQSRSRIRSVTKTRKTQQSEAFRRRISIPSLVDGVVEDFVMLERKRLWEATAHPVRPVSPAKGFAVASSPK